MKNTNERNNVEIDSQTFSKRQFYTNDDSGKVFILAVLLPYIITFVFAFIAGLVARDENVSQSLGYLIPASFIAPLSFGLIFFLYNKMFKISYKASTIANKVRWQDCLIAVFVALVSLFGLMLFINCHDVFLESVLKYELTSDLGIPLSNVGWLILNIFLFAILPGIFEELVFRGIVLQGFRKNFSDAIAVVLSALFFALMHGSLQQLIYPFLLGLIFGWLALRTGSIVTTMIVHILNNSLVLIIGYCNLNFASFQNVWWYYLLAFGLLVVVGVIFFLIDKFYFKSKNQNDIEKEKVKQASPFVWVGLAIGVILLILSIVMNYIS